MHFDCSTYLFIVLFASSPSFAQNTSPEKTAKVDKPEAWNVELSNEVNSMANRIDSYFGEIRSDDERSGSTLRVAPQMQVGEFLSPQSSVDFRLNLRLKNLEKLGRDIGDKLFNSDPEVLDQNRPLPSDKSFEEEAQPKDTRWDWTKSIETRAAGLAPPTYGSLFRIRKNYQDNAWIHRFWWSTGWMSDLLWQNEANFSSDFVLNKSFLFRMFNQWTYNMSSSLQGTSHGPSFYQTVSDNLSISYDSRINMAIEAGAWVLDNYSFGSTIRRRLKNKWIYLELDSLLDFGRAHGFQRQFLFLAKVEFVFGEF